MKTTKELLLEQLNAYRERTGKKPIKAWKESRAKLEAAIIALDLIELTQVEKAMAQEDADDIADLEAGGDGTTAASQAFNTKAPKAVKAAVKKVARDNADNPLSVFCEKHDINPKVARAKLRRAGLSAPYTQAQVNKHLSE